MLWIEKGLAEASIPYIHTGVLFIMCKDPMQPRVEQSVTYCDMRVESSCFLITIATANRFNSSPDINVLNTSSSSAQVIYPVPNNQD